MLTNNVHFEQTSLQKIIKIQKVDVWSLLNCKFFGPVWVVQMELHVTVLLVVPRTCDVYYYVSVYKCRSHGIHIGIFTSSHSPSTGK